MNSRVFSILLFIFGVTLGPSTYAQNNGKAERLQQLLKQFPAADTNHDGKLTWQEALAYRNKMGAKTGSRKQGRGVPTTFEVDAGWQVLMT